MAGLPTEPHGLTAGLPNARETCGRRSGGVGRPAPNDACSHCGVRADAFHRECVCMPSDNSTSLASYPRKSASSVATPYRCGYAALCSIQLHAGRNSPGGTSTAGRRFGFSRGFAASSNRKVRRGPDFTARRNAGRSAALCPRPDWKAVIIARTAPFTRSIRPRGPLPVQVLRKRNR